MEQLSSAAIADFFGPAVDGPPSPQRLRQLSMQMKRASHLQRQRGHRTTSSDSSSLSSLTSSDRLPLESTLDNSSFLRRASIRSNDCGTPSRDRPDSIPNFGRGFFHRRGKSNRESGAHASTESAHSPDVTGGGNPAVAGKESILPSIFFRRKASSDETAPKRPQISHPFNFQHVAHKENGCVRNRASPLVSLKGPTGFSTLETGVALNDLRRDPSQVSPRGMNVGHAAENSTRPPLVPHHTAPSLGHRRLPKKIRSQGKLGRSQSSAPPRPPRSPTQQLGNLSSFALPLPPRTSSRQSLLNHRTMSATLEPGVNIDSMVRTNALHQQSPLSPSFPGERSPKELSFRESMPTAHAERSYSLPDEKRLSSVVSAARDSTWPLCDPVLPDVPEEEEHQHQHHGLSRRSRLSVASNDSSLRCTQSVPMLRHLAESHHRRTSGASETLGSFGIMETRRLIPADAHTSVHLSSPSRESWEDLIDYCYEHEAEANCDYQWDRPSLDISRESITPPGTAQAGLPSRLDTECSTGSPTRQASLLLTASQVPSLSPASNTSSTQFETEAKTPNSVFLSTFSLSQGAEKKLTLVGSKEIQPLSGYAASQESPTCHLSPLSLIPSDWQQEMLQHEAGHEADKQAYSDYEFLVEHCHQSTAFHDDAELSLANNTSFSLVDQRISTSTTASDSTSRSNSIQGQNRSTNSSWSTLTRRTVSISSLSKMAVTLTDGSEPLPTTQLANVALGETKKVNETLSAVGMTQAVSP
ncbi:hypothetical protein E4U42_006112 [Claviceps africana]|uniref:CRIB domain-containing protein n=1 Tax=Claviceps africana TaxID=83212 RepID=A0A8K0JHA9_9HYPO|nr:hypothetical protein E4U42_006112 [Claviceps africana]